MNILVTGGAGFIGTHLCHELSAQGHQVRCLDLRRPESPVDRVEYITGNVLDVTLLENLIYGVEAVFHLAAMASVPLCQSEPVESYTTNVQATILVLEAIRKEISRSQRPVRLVFSGSSVVYGDRAGEFDRCEEESLLPPPLSHYGAQKLAAEYAIRIAATSQKIPAVTFRFFNVYGPGQDDHSPYSGVITQFVNRILKGEVLFLHGGGKQTRDFIAVEDVTRACAATLSLPVEYCQGQAINLGSGNRTSIRQLAELMGEASSRHVNLLDTPQRPGDVPHSLASIDRAKETLHWEPRMPLGLGLERLLEYYAKRRSAPAAAFYIDTNIAKP